MIFSFAKRSALALLSMLIFTAAGWAQTGTTSLRGTVTDEKGASVPGATVTLASSEIGVSLTTKTDKDGAYQFLEVRPATYTLTVAAQGFATLKQNGLQLLVSTPTTVNISMKVASVSTTVEVSAAAQVINTQDATLGTAFSATQLDSLPTEGRDPVGILSLMPGVVVVADREQVDLNADSRGGSVNGARSDQTNVTLDGVDDNDQLKGFAFTGALRATLDSIEEFRVTTSNSGANQGRSSGAQVVLVTKGGGNDWHGTAYEYNRPNNLVANDYFHKHAELAAVDFATGLAKPLPNKPPFLLRNTFGGSFLGPVKKDRMFFFLAYEGQRTRESAQVRRTVPSVALKHGVIQYLCTLNADGSLNTAQCPGGVVVQGLGQNPTQPISATNPAFTVTTQPGYNALGPAQIAQMDGRAGDSQCTFTPPAPNPCPSGPSVDLASIATMNLYPDPNTNQLGDGFNYQGYTFSAPTPGKLDTYVARFDYNINASGTQRLFARLGLQNDHFIPANFNGAAQFPGQPPRDTSTNNSKGIIAGYSWTISPTKINTLHYGFIRQGIGDNGVSNQHFAVLRGLDDPTAPTRSTNVVVPVHNVTDDFSWTKGKHTIQFGGSWRFVNNIRLSDAQSFTDAVTNAGFLPATGFAGRGTSYDPGAFAFPGVDSSFHNSYNFPMTALAGLITEVDATYVRDKTGTTLPEGAFVPRHFRSNEFEPYLQDAWRIKPNVTLTFGVRYSLLQPPHEINGEQVAPNISLGDFFNTRMKDMVQGISFSPLFSLDLSGQANGKKPYWGWDYKDIAPRFSLAWSPGYREGLLGSLFGGPGKSSLRLGAGIYYDHFGQGITNSFDKNGSFGLVTTVSTIPGTVGPDTAPKYTGIHDIPASITPAGPSGPFPTTPPNAYQPGGFAIYWGLDDKLKTPYSYGFDLSYSRELKGGFVFEAAYVNRLGRRLLQERDLGQPLNLFDPKAGIGYNQALTALAKIYRTGETTQNFNPSQVSPQVAQYWADILQPLEGPNPGNGGLGGAYQMSSCTGTVSGSPIVLNTTSAVTAAYDLFCGGSLNETTPLFVLDVFGITDGNNVPNCGVPVTPPTPPNPPCNPSYFPKNGPLSFFQSQFASLYAWSSIGRSNYNAGQFSLRHRAAHGLTWDFNYTYSRSIDIGSNAERINEFEGFGFASQIINAFEPQQNRAVSDFDTTHQFNTNWVYEMPFGRAKKWGSGWNRGVDAVLGGWSWSGLARWTTGFPFTVSNGFDFPTNWQLTGNGVLAGARPRTGAFTDCAGDMSAFAFTGQSCSGGASTTASNSINSTWRFPFPGESGDRNNFRGPGYFGIDMAIRKAWKFTERQNLAFSWEVFNITNSVRFDAANTFPAIDTAGSFGTYANTLTRPRVMEFALRFSF